MNIEIKEKILKSLDLMVKEDQEIRIKYSGNKEKLRAIDKINHLKIKEIVEKYGLIDIPRFGKDVSHNAFLIIQHTPISESDFAIHYLALAEANLDKIDKRKYAYLKDRVNLRIGKPQIFGTQFRTDVSTGKIYFNNLYNPGEVDIRRSELGLEPLSQYILKIEENTNVKVMPPSGYKSSVL